MLVDPDFYTSAGRVLRDVFVILRDEAEARHRASIHGRHSIRLQQSMARVAARQAAVQQRVNDVHARVQKIHEERMLRVQNRMDAIHSRQQKRMDEVHARVQKRMDEIHKRYGI